MHDLTYAGIDRFSNATLYISEFINQHNMSGIVITAGSCGEQSVLLSGTNRTPEVFTFNQADDNIMDKIEAALKNMGE